VNPEAFTRYAKYGNVNPEAFTRYAKYGNVNPEALNIKNKAIALEVVSKNNCPA
jgi:hypothetical protein